MTSLRRCDRDGRDDDVNDIRLPEGTFREDRGEVTGDKEMAAGEVQSRQMGWRMEPFLG